MMYVDIVIMQHAIATAIARYNENQEITAELFINIIKTTYWRNTDGKRN